MKDIVKKCANVSRAYRDRTRQRLRLVPRYYNYRTGKLKPAAYPHRMYIESTNHCNLRCIMCPTGLRLMNRPQGFMDKALFRRIIDEMAPHVTATTVHIWGEPLLHPDIFEMISYAAQGGLNVELSTNAVLLDEETAVKLLDSGICTVYLCLDGLTKETYEKIRRRADFSTVLRNVERFVELKRQRLSRNRHANPTVNVQVIDMKPTQAEISEFVRRWKRDGVDHVNVKAFDSWGNQVDPISRLSKETSSLPAKRYPCPNLWYHVHIYWDGTIVCCDRDFNAAYPLDNVEQGVMQAWNGDRMARLRQKHISLDLEDVPSCRKCVEWSWWRPGWFSAWGNSPQARNVGDDEIG